MTDPKEIINQQITIQRETIRLLKRQMDPESLVVPALFAQIEQSQNLVARALGLLSGGARATNRGWH